MEHETIKAFYNRRTNQWEVRLRETIGDSTKEGAERRAKIMLAAYNQASLLLVSPIQILNKATVAECNYWQGKTKQLQAELGKREKLIMSNILEIIKDYIKVNQAEMSQMFFCLKYNIGLREFTPLSYVIESELRDENKQLKKNINNVCDLINNEEQVNKWKILNWLCKS